MIDKDLSIDRSRTSPLKPELEKGVETGDLLAPSEKTSIDTGDLLAPESKESLATGDLLTSEVASGIPTGDLLTPNPLPSPNDDHPLNYARIGYDNILYGGTAISATGNLYPENMLYPDTYSSWGASGDQEFSSARIDIANSQPADYIGIAAHTLAGYRLVLSIRDSFGDTDDVYDEVVTSNDPLYIPIPSDDYDRLNISVYESSPGSGISSGVKISVVYMGVVLQMMRPVYGGHRPVTLSATDKITPQTSDGGQFLGKQIVRQGFSTQADFKHLEGEWYRDKFQPFVEHAKTLPYFWAWNLEEHQDEIVYGWSNEMITPTLMGIRNWFEVSFSIEAHA